MNIVDMFSLESETKNILTVQSSWVDFSHYFMFLTLKNGGCSKSSSGSLSLLFPTHFKNVGEIQAELGGYDTQTMARHEYVKATSETELKEKLILIFEKERFFIIDNNKSEKPEEPEEL